MIRQRDQAPVVDSSVRLPRGIYRVRVINTKFGKSAKGNDMTTLDCEIIEPEVINIDGRDVNIAGKKFAYYLVHNMERGFGGQGAVFEFCDKVEVDIEDGYDDSLHRDYFFGLEFDALLDSEEDFKRHRPEPGEKVGKVMKDGEGKPIFNGYRVIAQLQDVLAKCNPSKNYEFIEANPI